jgi:xanthine dehydrogenase/oxidase
MECSLILLNTNNDKRRVEMRNFFKSYRKTELKEDEIILSIFIPNCKKNEYITSFKQAKRREDDIAIVTSGFKIEVVEKDKKFYFEKSSISFGGIQKYL